MRILNKDILVSCIFLIALILFFFYDIIFLNKTLSTTSLLLSLNGTQTSNISKNIKNVPFSFDITGNAFVNEPNPYIVRRILDSSKIPAWNPFEGLGIPLIGNLNTEVFNPLKIFLNLYPNPYLQDIFFLLRLFVMGLFTYLFLRELKLLQISSLFGAVFLMLSGYSMWWINLHPLSTVMYMPGVFYFYERWRKKREIKSAFLVSLFIAFGFSAGKTPELIMSICLLFIYSLLNNLDKKSLKVLFRGNLNLFILIFSGLLLSAIVLLPFIELYIHASPIAKSIRTGASCPTLPLISSVSMIQPLFLGINNYYYTSWLKWKPDMMMPHTSIVIFFLFIYGLFNKEILKRLNPFYLFVFLILFFVFGILPTKVISWIPIIRSIELLKYNAMVYFSMAIISAVVLDKILKKEGRLKKINLSIFALLILLGIYYYFLYKLCPPEIEKYLLIVFICSIIYLIIISLVFYIFKSRNVSGLIILFFLIIELFLYMPKGHPDRVNPYLEGDYIKILKEETPYRIIGSGDVIPALKSNAIGLYDLRTINVLLPGDYYTFFENLISFSVPYTNNPEPAFFMTSPFIDLLGIKYMLSREKVDFSHIEKYIKWHVDYLRWIRFFNSMVNHSIEGIATYGFFEKDGQKRFSLFFSNKFIFKIKLKVTEPYLMAHVVMKESRQNIMGKVKILIENKFVEECIDGFKWKNVVLDVSEYMNRIVDVVIAGEGDSEIVLSDFGLSPGKEKENEIYNNLLTYHKKEIEKIGLRGFYDGMYTYENENVMDRAFMVNKIIKVNDLNGAIDKLQGGINFRDIALIEASDVGFDISFNENSAQEKVYIVKYSPDEVILKVDTKGGLLVLSDLYYPGWKVKVNGKEEKIIKTFGVLRGVLLREGRNEVVFYYRPLSFYIGALISLLTFTVWIIYLLKHKKIS